MASNKKVSKKKLYACNYDGCSATFKRLIRLKYHIRIHKNERPYICSYDDCNKSYTNLSHLKRHQDVHEGKLKCPEDNCDKIFVSKETLQKHINNIHLRKKPKLHQCSYCDKEFNKHSWLLKHEYKHTNVKPYQCSHEGCGKRFINPSKLKRHEKIHKGYPCTKPDCNEVLPTWTLHVKHLKVAHPKIYKCDICEREFSVLHALKCHLETHQIERTVYICSEEDCSRYYYLKRNLKYHIKSYHEKRPFKCSVKYCHKAFKTKEDLDAHLRKHDPTKRLRKRKKKKKSKLTFAAVLAGHNESKSELETKNADIKEECSKINEEKGKVTSESDSETKKNCASGDILTLLNMVNKTNYVSTNIETNCIPLQA